MIRRLTHIEAAHDRECAACLDAMPAHAALDRHLALANTEDSLRIKLCYDHERVLLPTPYTLANPCMPQRPWFVP